MENVRALWKKGKDQQPKVKGGCREIDGETLLALLEKDLARIPEEVKQQVISAISEAF
jgi:hypothetical protein